LDRSKGEGMKTNIHKLLEGKWNDGTRPKDIFGKYVSKKPSSYVEAIVQGLKSKNKRVENGCAELASLLSEVEPELICPYIDLFTANLRAKEPVVRWEAACTIGNLAGNDKRKIIPDHIPELTKLLGEKSIALQGHAVKALAKIAKTYPREAPAILESLLAARTLFPGNRIGYLVEAMESFTNYEKLEKKALSFVSPLTDSEIGSVTKKACRVLKKMDVGS
jgi:hypothetical protein